MKYKLIKTCKITGAKIFRPYVFKVKSRDIIKERNFSDLVGEVLEREHCYFHLNSNIGYLILN